MDEYTIYCTKEQTKKALELGAPIHEHPFNAEIIKYNEKLFHNIVYADNKYYYIPTAEQMIGWLREKRIVLDIISHYIGDNIYNYYWDRNQDFSDDITYETYKEATLAAIDNALEYLKTINLKK